MSDRTHSHCQCDNCSGEDCRDLPKPKTLSNSSKSELVAELIKRDGVDSLRSYWGYHIAIKMANGRNNGQTSTGEARILVVKE